MEAIPLFFTPAMAADAGRRFPSAAKPRQVVASWQTLGIPLAVFEPEPVSFEELALAHDADFVRGVLSGALANGFGTRSPGVAASLRWTSGAMRSAARYARKHGAVAVAPCSGFHHAGWARAAGFCTFNGLMVTAASLHAEGAKRIGILDCDHHYGDGTEAIIHHLAASDWVTHFTAGRDYVRPAQADAFFAALPDVLRSMRDCDVVLYQAGADPHIDDPLGGWLTTAQLAERDRLVFEGFASLGVPVAWNLAGGYQCEADGSIPKVLEIHDNTLRACARAYGVCTPT